jgi:hypothetical protein
LRYSFLLLLLITCSAKTFSQGLPRYKADTITLYRYQYTKKVTNNGSDCICSVLNPGKANLAIAAITGSPDSIRFSNAIPFNGVHILQPGQQLNAIGNFMGKQLVIMNISPMSAPLTVMIFCPDD